MQRHNLFFSIFVTWNFNLDDFLIHDVNNLFETTGNRCREMG